VAVNVFVIDATRCSVDGSATRRDATSAKPALPLQARRPSCTTPAVAPGNRFSLTYAASVACSLAEMLSTGSTMSPSPSSW